VFSRGGVLSEGKKGVPIAFVRCGAQRVKKTNQVGGGGRVHERLTQRIMSGPRGNEKKKELEMNKKTFVKGGGGGKKQIKPKGWFSFGAMSMEGDGGGTSPALRGKKKGHRLVKKRALHKDGKRRDFWKIKLKIGKTKKSVGFGKKKQKHTIQGKDKQGVGSSLLTMKSHILRDSSAIQRTSLHEG